MGRQNKTFEELLPSSPKLSGYREIWTVGFSAFSRQFNISNKTSDQACLSLLFVSLNNAPLAYLYGVRLDKSARLDIIFSLFSIDLLFVFISEGWLAESPGTAGTAGTDGAHTAHTAHKHAHSTDGSMDGGETFSDGYGNAVSPEEEFSVNWLSLKATSP